MKARDLRELSQDELNERLRERTAALMTHRLQLATGTAENVRAARNTRREIARIKTILRQRELAARKGPEQA